MPLLLNATGLINTILCWCIDSVVLVIHSTDAMQYSNKKWGIERGWMGKIHWPREFAKKTKKRPTSEFPSIPAESFLEVPEL